MPKQVGDITLYTVLELSKLLDVTEVTLRRYIKSGRLKAKTIGGAYHISEEALKEFIDNGDRAEQAEPKAEASDTRLPVCNSWQYYEPANGSNHRRICCS